MLNRIVFILLLLVNTFVYASDDAVYGLDLVKKPNNHKAVIVIGGAVSSYKVMQKYIDLLDNADVGIYGFIGNAQGESSPFNIDYMPDNADILTQALKELNTKGITELYVVSACIGGLVAISAVHNVESIFNHIKLVTLSTPLGGYYVSIPADTIPGIRYLTKQLGVAMSADLAPTSDFFKSLNVDFNSNTDTVYIDSLNDSFVKPGTELTKTTYANMSARFKKHYLFDSHQDHMFALDPAQLNNSGIHILNLLGL